MKKLVVLTGAGMSADSGIATFRDSNGLWENHRVEDVASPEGFSKNPELVLDFYNQRRKNARDSTPHSGFFDLVRLEEQFEVTIITQNIDDLHERAGSSHVLHLHGEILKARSTQDPNLIIPWTKDNLNLGDLGPDGAQLRPHIVWFGEAVPMLEEAIPYVAEADELLIIGTSLQVYPAASLHQFTHAFCTKSFIDPNAHLMAGSDFHLFSETAKLGIAVWAKEMGIKF
ncbi:MAG: NAD-dependent deacetylase [Luteibaculaceae bacterium]|jgi:NAD-dependent deacetylase